MEKIVISIIIPTYNRKDVLLKTLNALNRQSYDLSQTEVIVIDDCSPVNPENEIESLKTAYKIRFFRETQNIGQGRIRNEGLRIAVGQYVFFIGDDTVPDGRFIEEHMNLHNKTPGIAVLGRVVWAPELRNEFMDFVEKIQFHYHTIKDRDNVRLHFYTSNISLEKKWFDKDEYSSEFRNYGLEDLELGHRLEKRGLRVVYNPEAVVYHFHSYTFEQFCSRMRNVGRSAVIFAKLHPELKRKYILPFRYLLRLGSFLLSQKPIGSISNKIYWYSNFIYNYLEGVEEELNNIKST